MAACDLPDHVACKRAVWDRWASNYAASGRRDRQAEPHWGIWGVPEAELHILPDVAGQDTIELGCGTAYVSA